MTSMPMRRLGRNGPKVSALGLGCMSYMQPGEEAGREAVRTIQAAMDVGFIFLDTADFYGSGISEMNVGKAIRGRRERAFLSVKFGVQTSPTRGIIGLDGRPNSVKNFATYSLRRLGVDMIDLYQPACADPDVPYEETIGAVADLIQEGKVRYLGVSEVGADLLRRAHAVHPVTALEIEYSLACRFIEADILPTARALGIGIVAYRILADGLLTGGLPQGQPPQSGHFVNDHSIGTPFLHPIGPPFLLQVRMGARASPRLVGVAAGARARCRNFQTRFLKRQLSLPVSTMSQ